MHRILLFASYVLGIVWGIANIGVNGMLADAADTHDPTLEGRLNAAGITLDRAALSTLLNSIYLLFLCRYSGSFNDRYFNGQPQAVTNHNDGNEEKITVADECCEGEGGEKSCSPR